MNHPKITTSPSWPLMPPILRKNDRPTGRPYDQSDKKNNDTFNWMQHPRNAPQLLKRPTANLLQVVLLIAPCREIMDQASVYVPSGSMLVLQTDGYVEIKMLPMTKTWEKHT